MKKINRVLIAAPKSGSGKTIITCGLLRLLMNRGYDAASFKCGPDFIDPMFHREVVGVPGDNLDPFFCDEDMLRKLVHRKSKDGDNRFIVMEGAMGIYDGISGQGKIGSCYQVALHTGTPIILVIDAKGIGTTIASIIKGILIDDTENLIAGIILNRASESYLNSVRQDIEHAISETASAARIIGYIPNDPRLKLESRHLGLKRPEEIEDLSKQVEDFAHEIESNCDVEKIIAIMEGADSSIYDGLSDSDKIDNDKINLRLAVARDEAFCFYYEENLRMLREAGIEIVEFSPIHDEKLPENIQGLLLGGGYPELYLNELSQNTGMRDDIKRALDHGMPSLAECGGFMYLLDEVLDKSGGAKEMVGVISGSAKNTGKLSRFGYIELTSKGNVNSNDNGHDWDGDGNLLGPGESIKGHEFHYYDSTNNGTSLMAEKANKTRRWECCHMGRNHIWGYPHLYYPSNPRLIANLRESMIEYKQGKE